MMKALSFSETSILTRATRSNIPEDGILHSHRLENLKSYDDVVHYVMLCDEYTLQWAQDGDQLRRAPQRTCR
jgi:hypothetical protein